MAGVDVLVLLHFAGTDPLVVGIGQLYLGVDLGHYAVVVVDTAAHHIFLPLSLLLLLPLPLLQKLVGCQPVCQQVEVQDY